MIFFTQGIIIALSSYVNMLIADVLFTLNLDNSQFINQEFILNIILTVILAFVLLIIIFIFCRTTKGFNYKKIKLLIISFLINIIITIFMVKLNILLFPSL